MGKEGLAPAYQPETVPGVAGAESISGSAEDACALSSGTVSCWGANARGQLGGGSAGFDARPVAVQGISSATAVSVGFQDACAVVEAGEIACWGDNSEGQLGDGSSEAYSATPVTVANISSAKSVTVSRGDSACAVLLDGDVECWGFGPNGQLGDGSTASSNVPVRVAGITTAVSLSTTGESVCAVMVSGEMQCWGANLDGSLGDGSTESSTVPMPVVGITEAAEAQTVGYLTCARLRVGTVDCWGANVWGELGDGVTGGFSDTPVRVQSITSATAISVGGNFACALLAGGSVDCWGSNERGELGNGTRANSSTPTPVR